MSGRTKVSELVSRIERELDENPPVIVWQPNSRGVQVAVSVYDPHPEGPVWKQRKNA